MLSQNSLLKSTAWVHTSKYTDFVELVHWRQQFEHVQGRRLAAAFHQHVRICLQGNNVEVATETRLLRNSIGLTRMESTIF